LKGKNISDTNKDKLGKAERSSRLRPQITKKLPGGATGERPKRKDMANASRESLGFYCRVKYSVKWEDRWILPVRWNDDGDLDDLHQIYIDQGFEGVQEKMQEHLDNYFEGMDIEEVIEIQAPQ